LRYQKKSDLFLSILIALCIASDITAVISFIIYVRARMKEQERKEKLFLKIHYSSLFILFLLGMVYMFVMIEKAN
jgi:hypothetical protein